MFKVLCLAAVAVCIQSVSAMLKPGETYPICRHCSSGICMGATAPASGTILGCAGTDYMAVCDSTYPMYSCKDDYCGAGMIWNEHDKMCTHCLHGWTYHPDKNQCLCASGTGINPVTMECVICGPAEISVDGHCKCKNPDKFWNYWVWANMPPHHSRHRCMDCPKTTHKFGDNCACNKMQMWFDVKDMAHPCKPCANGALFDKIRGRCMCMKKGYVIAKRLRKCVKAPNTPAPTLASA